MAELTRPELEASPPASFGSPKVSLNSLLGALIAALGALITIRPISDNSFLTHLATGRLIVDTGSVPTTDPYSFTAHGHPWVVQSWLASLLYGLADRAVGLNGVRVIHGLLGAVLGALIWKLTERAVTTIPRVAIAGVGVVIGGGLWAGRPLLFGLVGLALLMVIVDGRADLRWLLPVMWIWVNTHGSFPFAVLLLGLLWVGKKLDGQDTRREVHALAWVIGGILLGALNPLGPRLLFFPLTLLSKRQSFSLIEEWKPPHFNNVFLILFAVQLALACLLTLRRCRRWQIALPLLVFGALALTSARNVAPASLVMMPGLALAAAGLGSVVGERRIARGGLFAAALGFLVIVMLGASLAGPATDLDTYPEAAVTWLEARSLLNPKVVAREYVGNYLEARYGTRVKVFTDDRVDMFPDSVVADMVTLLRARPGWELVLNKYQPAAVLWERDSRLARLLARSDRWHLAWKDKNWVVYLPA